MLLLRTLGVSLAAALVVACSAQELLARVTSCAKKLSSAPYAKDQGGQATIDVCGLTGAVFWRADMDIDCDGKRSSACNTGTDASYQPETASDSSGQPLDAASLPFVVVPMKSTRWDYKASGLALGNVVAVMGGDREGAPRRGSRQGGHARQVAREQAPRRQPVSAPITSGDRRRTRPRTLRVR